MTVTLCDVAQQILDASGGSVFRNLLGAAKGALIRAAASTQTFGGSLANDISCLMIARFVFERVADLLLPLQNWLRHHSNHRNRIGTFSQVLP